MKQRTNYYAQYMSEDYAKLQQLLDNGNVVVCFVDYVYDTGGKKIVYRDVAKAKSNEYGIMSKNYGYVVEARGIIYMSWDKRMLELRGITFDGLCEEIRLQFIDYAEYRESTERERSYTR